MNGRPGAHTCRGRPLWVMMSQETEAAVIQLDAPRGEVMRSWMLLQMWSESTNESASSIVL